MMKHNAALALFLAPVLVASCAAPVSVVEPAATPAPLPTPGSMWDVIPSVSPDYTPATVGVTMAAYSKLNTGMSYEEAVALLGGPGEEMSRSEMAGFVTVMYTWKGSGSLGANMNAMFQNNKLVSKAQFGLK